MSLDLIQRLAAQLNARERDVLKYRLAQTVISTLERSSTMPAPLGLLMALREIHPHRVNVPSSGLCGCATSGVPTLLRTNSSRLFASSASIGVRKLVSMGIR